MKLNDPQVTKRDAINFADALTLLFIALKLTDHIDWSWWLVVSPIAIQMVLVVVAVIATKGEA